MTRHHTTTASTRICGIRSRHPAPEVAAIERAARSRCGSSRRPRLARLDAQPAAFVRGGADVAVRRSPRRRLLVLVAGGGVVDVALVVAGRPRRGRSTPRPTGCAAVARRRRAAHIAGRAIARDIDIARIGRMTVARRHAPDTAVSTQGDPASPDARSRHGARPRLGAAGQRGRSGRPPARSSISAASSTSRPTPTARVVRVSIGMGADREQHRRIADSGGRDGRDRAPVARRRVPVFDDATPAFTAAVRALEGGRRADGDAAADAHHRRRRARARRATRC